MGVVQRRLSKSFKAFFDSEKASGIVMVVCTIVSLIIANSMLGGNYAAFWKMYLGNLSVEHWVNDLLMAVFFLLIGLELERELKNGELSNFKNALLPIFAAIGGIVVPALIHYLLNTGTPTQNGIGIPMATDIAFALGALSLLGNRVPASLKIFLTALAVIDDLCAIIVIAVFYTATLSAIHLFGAIVVLGILFLLKKSGVNKLTPYLIGGALLWLLMLKSGIHPTIAGVLLAFTIPFSATEDDEDSPSYKLENALYFPVAFIILPIFVLANAGIVLSSEAVKTLSGTNELGIIAGLVIGKPIGILLLSFIVVAAGICKLPLDLNWKHIFGAGLLGGIGFTMSIFITNLAFATNPTEISGSKLAIFLASLTAGTIGFLWLKLLGQPEESDDDMDTMDFDVTEV